MNKYKSANHKKKLAHSYAHNTVNSSAPWTSKAILGCQMKKADTYFCLCNRVLQPQVVWVCVWLYFEFLIFFVQFVAVCSADFKSNNCNKIKNNISSFFKYIFHLWQMYSLFIHWLGHFCINSRAVLLKKIRLYKFILNIILSPKIMHNSSNTNNSFMNSHIANQNPFTVHDKH